VANIALCNLLNDSGVDAKFYGPHHWHIGKCRADLTSNLEIKEDDILIVHYLVMPERPADCGRVVLSCHETSLYPLRRIPSFWDDIHYVSAAQRDWHGVDGTVIPNRITGLVHNPTCTGIAGVIGSIDPHKRTHVSIQRAIEDGFRVVYLFGEVNDPAYFERHIRSYVDANLAECKGFVDDKQRIYDSIEAVYHSSASETFNLVKAECEVTGTAYHGVKTADPDVELLSDEQLLDKWTKLLGLS
jgi:hypothetical protein